MSARAGLHRAGGPPASCSGSAAADTACSDRLGIARAKNSASLLSIASPMRGSRSLLRSSMCSEMSAPPEKPPSDLRSVVAALVVREDPRIGSRQCVTQLIARQGSVAHSDRYCAGRRIRIGRGETLRCHEPPCVHILAIAVGSDPAAQGQELFTPGELDPQIPHGLAAVQGRGHPASNP